MTDGAYSLSRRLPNWLLTAGVATTTPAPRGLAASARRTSSFAVGTPRASRAAHISGSQATVTLRLTCCATQSAASWAASAGRRAAGAAAAGGVTAGVQPGHGAGRAARHEQERGPPRPPRAGGTRPARGAAGVRFGRTAGSSAGELPRHRDPRPRGSRRQRLARPAGSASPLGFLGRGLLRRPAVSFVGYGFLRSSRCPRPTRFVDGLAAPRLPRLSGRFPGQQVPQSTGSPGQRGSSTAGSRPRFLERFGSSAGGVSGSATRSAAASPAGGDGRFWFRSSTAAGSVGLMAGGGSAGGCSTGGLVGGSAGSWAGSGRQERSSGGRSRSRRAWSRLARAASVSGWPAPSTCSRPARVCSRSGIASDVRPAAR